MEDEASEHAALTPATVPGEDGLSPSDFHLPAGRLVQQAGMP